MLIHVQRSYRSTLETVLHTLPQSSRGDRSSEVDILGEQFPRFEVGGAIATPSGHNISIDMAPTFDHMKPRLPIDPDTAPPDQAHKALLMKIRPEWYSTLGKSSGQCPQPEGGVGHDEATDSFLAAVDERLRHLDPPNPSTVNSLASKEPLPAGKALRHQPNLLTDSRHSALPCTRPSSYPESRAHCDMQGPHPPADVKPVLAVETKPWGDLSSDFSQSLDSLAKELGVPSQHVRRSSVTHAAPDAHRPIQKTHSRNFSRPFSSSSAEQMTVPHPTQAVHSSRQPSADLYAVRQEEQQANNDFFGGQASVYSSFLTDPIDSQPPIDADLSVEPASDVFESLARAASRVKDLAHAQAAHIAELEEAIAQTQARRMHLERLLDQSHECCRTWEDRGGELAATDCKGECETQQTSLRRTVNESRKTPASTTSVDFTLPLPHPAGVEHEQTGLWRLSMD